MTTLKSTRFVRIFAAFLTAGAILMTVPALQAAPADQPPPASLAAAGVTTSLSLRALDDTPDTSAPAERIKLAAKLSTVAKGAAVGSRLARGSKKSEEQNKEDKEAEAETEAQSDNSAPDPTTTPSGPFKLVIPSQSEPADQNATKEAAPAADATPATPPAAAASGPVRTILDRNDQNAAAPPTTAPAAPPSIAIPATAQRQPELPPTKDAADSGCIAGCYAPTSTQLTGPAARRAAAAPAVAPQNGIECLAGCDGVNGRQLPRATSAAATPATGQAAASSSPQSGSNRVVIMRGNSRTKSYGISQ